MHLHKLNNIRICASNNIDTSIVMKLAKTITRVYLMGVLLSLAHFHLVRTMKCGLHTQGQVSDAVHTATCPLYLTNLRIAKPTFRHAKQ